MMTAAELIELLEDLDPDTEIRVATQPSWPMEYTLTDRTSFQTSIPGILYLSVGDQIGYLSGEVADEIGWGR